MLDHQTPYYLMGDSEHDFDENIIDDSIPEQLSVWAVEFGFSMIVISKF